MRSLTSSHRVVVRVLNNSSQGCSLTRKLHSSTTFQQSILNTIGEKSRHASLVFHSTSQNPYQNLALEHYLLTQSHASSRILLFYTNRPCVVIGRNQNPWSECNLQLLQQGLYGEPVDLVRRRSGGGTVFHDAGNLNFSVIVPNDADFTRRKHAELVVKAIQAPNTGFAESKAFESIWVNDRHDIVMKTQEKVFKSSGSAFKLTRGRALHHGTLLHSSPNLKEISRILRSPSASYIQAKGVESVRSPVSNLYNIPDGQRDKLRAAITKAIVDQFTSLYGCVTEYNMGESDFSVPAIQGGLDELLTDEWRFGQTPRFEFRSPTVDGQQIFLSVNRGVVEEASLVAMKGRKLAEIEDWSATIVPALDSLLRQTFPFVAKVNHNEHMNRNSVVDQLEQRITRRLADGSVEIEHEQNTVVNK